MCDRQTDRHTDMPNIVIAQPKGCAIRKLGFSPGSLDKSCTDQKVKSVEEVNKTLNTRVESLESWNNKQSEEINKLAEHIESLDANGVIVKESGEIKVLKRKVLDLEQRLARLSKKSRSRQLLLSLGRSQSRHT